MTDWTITVHTPHGTRSIISVADNPAAARAAALRAAHTLIDSAQCDNTQYQLHIDRQLLARLGSAPDDASRSQAHKLIDRLDHTVDPYSY